MLCRCARERGRKREKETEREGGGREGGHRKHRKTDDVGVGVWEGRRVRDINCRFDLALHHTLHTPYIAHTIHCT